MYVKACNWELYDGKNPADRLKKFPNHSRERFVQSNELPWLLKSLADERPKIETYFLTLLLTGARRDEARTMQWKDLDLERALWHKPTTKTGVPHTVPLPQQLVTRLRALPRVNDWVFPSTPNTLNGFTSGEWSQTAVEYHCKRSAGGWD
jgi:integrase